MFKYLFNGVLYTAETLEELQELLEAAGFEGNIVDIYNAIETLQEEEDSFIEEQNDLVIEYEEENTEALKEVLSSEDEIEVAFNDAEDLFK
jgi:regulator of replication initiation timing